jgi:hypothetical protein
MAGCACKIVRNAKPECHDELLWGWRSDGICKLLLAILLPVRLSRSPEAINGEPSTGGGLQTCISPILAAMIVDIIALVVSSNPRRQRAASAGALEALFGLLDCRVGEAICTGMTYGERDSELAEVAAQASLQKLSSAEAQARLATIGRGRAGATSGYASGCLALQAAAVGAICAVLRCEQVSHYHSLAFDNRLNLCRAACW